MRDGLPNNLCWSPMMSRIRRFPIRFLAFAFASLVLADRALDPAYATARNVLDGPSEATHSAESESGHVPGAYQPLAVLVFPPDETFAGVTLPDLPSGWTNDHTGAGPGWITVNNVVSSPPSAAFADDTDSVSDKSLETPPFDVVAHGRLTFLHSVDLEASTNLPDRAYDGVALEISINGGSFEDILDAGGVFVSGGYDHTAFLSASPLSGRPVWSGTSAGFLSVVVDLPAAASGQSIRLRWRMGTDASVGLSGYSLDDIHVDVDRPSTFPPDETFAEATLPELPPGWINDHTGAGPGWITVNDSVSSPPNAAFTDDTTTASDKSLVTPPFDVVSSGRVTFNHKLDLESSDGGLAYDGVVLEIAYDQSAFADIIEAGGTFVSGGYDYSILGSLNPLKGRAGWSGTSPGFLPVVVDLPPSANGRHVRLRWRVGTDLSIGRSGYWLDDIHVDLGAPSDEIFVDDFECFRCEP